MFDFTLILYPYMNNIYINNIKIIHIIINPIAKFTIKKIFEYNINN